MSTTATQSNVDTLLLSADFAPGEHWITKDAVHLLLRGGTIEKGPASLVGKKIEDLPPRHHPAQKAGTRPRSETS